MDDGSGDLDPLSLHNPIALNLMNFLLSSDPFRYTAQYSTPNFHSRIRFAVRSLQYYGRLKTQIHLRVDRWYKLCTDESAIECLDVLSLSLILVLNNFHLYFRSFI